MNKNKQYNNYSIHMYIYIYLCVMFEDMEWFVSPWQLDFALQA